jgi:hypothetical protein
MPVVSNNQDIFAYAAACVSNKGVITRIGHSSTLHSVRSAFSGGGSFASKFGSLVGAGIRATFACIPIPVVGSLLGSAEAAVEKAIKSCLHSRSRKTAVGADVVKFELKELSLEQMDRYRWKVQTSVQELNKVLTEFNTRYALKSRELAPCDAFLDAALAAEQATRRVRKLREVCLGVFAIMKLTTDWLDECENGTVTAPSGGGGGGGGAVPTDASINGVKNKLQRLITEKVEEQLRAIDSFRTEDDKLAYVKHSHSHCSGWCYFRTVGGRVDNWANFRQNAAAVVRTCAEPFGPDSFNNNLGSLW